MSSFNSLLPALVDVLETSREHDGSASKQSLLNSTNEFKEQLNKAKEEALRLPGGEMSLSDQEEVIKMLEELRDRKRAQIDQFSRLVIPDKSDDVPMIDSDVPTSQ